jgi:hypothetical protein
MMTYAWSSSGFASHSHVPFRGTLHFEIIAPALVFIYLFYIFSYHSLTHSLVNMD